MGDKFDDRASKIVEQIMLGEGPHWEPHERLVAAHLRAVDDEARLAGIEQGRREAGGEIVAWLNHFADCAGDIWPDTARTIGKLADAIARGDFAKQTSEAVLQAPLDDHSPSLVLPPGGDSAEPGILCECGHDHGAHIDGNDWVACDAAGCQCRSFSEAAPSPAQPDNREKIVARRFAHIESPDEREARAVDAVIAACDRGLSPAQPDTATLDSPPFVPAVAKEFAARGFSRVNRHAGPDSGEKCAACGGTGRRAASTIAMTEFGPLAAKVACWECHGTGKAPTTGASSRIGCRHRFVDGVCTYCKAPTTGGKEGR